MIDLIALTNYCPNIIPIGPSNSNTPIIFNTSITSVASYNCSIGYAGTPFSTCNTYNSTVGIWGNVVGNCSGTDLFFC